MSVRENESKRWKLNCKTRLPTLVVPGCTSISVLVIIPERAIGDSQHEIPLCLIATERLLNVSDDASEIWDCPRQNLLNSTQPNNY